VILIPLFLILLIFDTLFFKIIFLVPFISKINENLWSASSSKWYDALINEVEFTYH